MVEEPVSTITLRKVRLGQEAEFEASLKDFFQRSRSCPGQRGVHVVRPVPGSESREWGIMRTFDSEQAKDDFFRSPLFLEWQAVAAPFMEGEHRRQSVTGLETWFTLPGSQAMVPPPKWKMMLLSTLGGALAATGVGLLLGPSLSALAPFARTLSMSLAIAIVMTWWLMPLLSRLLRPWLYQNNRPKGV